MNWVKENLFKKQMIITYVVVILLVAASLFIGNSVATTRIDEEKVDYEKITKMIEEKEENLENIETDIEIAETNYIAISDDLSEAKDLFDEVKAIVDDRDVYIEEKETAQAEVEKLKQTQDDLNKEISSKESELSKLTGKIKEAKGQPKILPAGKFIVGKDIPAGRYKAVANGGSGNFFVNEGADVNTILGDHSYGEPEYIFTCYDGDEIEITTSVKFIPVE